jgi:predicted GNAT family N-acyltransferase
MFRVGQNVYATQFHPEGDSDGFILRIQVYKHFGYFDPNEADQLIQAVNQTPTPYAQHVLRRFVQRYYHDKISAEHRIDLLMMDWASAKPLAQFLREAVFIQVQSVPESEEWDEQDETAQHIIAFFNGQAVGTARLSVVAKVGRMAVLPAYRGKGIGSAMLSKLIHYAAKTTKPSLILCSQTHAQGFYQRHGFTARGKEFLDAGIPHIEMQLPIDEIKAV